jgi:phospholipid transport system transporter-binding protein
MQLPALATLNEAAALAALFPAAVAAGTGPWHIDASAVQQLDSSTLALMLQAQRVAHAAGRTVLISGAPPKLLALARLYGLEALLPLSPSAPGATSVSASGRAEAT